METTIGLRIKTAREIKDWSQNQLAHKTGLSSRTIARYESGTSKIPDGKLVILALTLNTSVSYLLGETNDASPDKEFAETKFMSPYTISPIVQAYDHIKTSISAASDTEMDVTETLLKEIQLAVEAERKKRENA